MGYDIVYTSIFKPETLEILREKLKNKTTVLAGHSGVGKSSLISALDPNIILDTCEVSEKSERGRHTTTTVTLLQVCFGGFVIDTPGVRELGLWNLEFHEVSKYFPEMQTLSLNCKYKKCTHTHEPHCAVKNGLETKNISQFRYEGYCKILESLKEEREHV